MFTCLGVYVDAHVCGRGLELLRGVHHEGEGGGRVVGGHQRNTAHLQGERDVNNSDLHKYTVLRIKALWNYLYIMK